MRHAILALAFIVPLAMTAPLITGCAHTRMIAEKVDTEADNLYVAIAETVNAYEALPGADVAKGEALKLKAWKALAVVRQAYVIGSTADLSPLIDLLNQAKALGQ